MKFKTLLMMLVFAGISFSSILQTTQADSRDSGIAEEESGAIHGICPKEITCTVNFSVNRHANPDDPSLPQTQVTGIATASCAPMLTLAPGQNFNLMPKGSMITLKEGTQFFTRASITSEGQDKEMDIVASGTYPSGLFSVEVSPAFQLAYSRITPSESKEEPKNEGDKVKISMIAENYCYYIFEGSIRAPSSGEMGGYSPQYNIKINLSYQQPASATNFGFGKTDAWTELSSTGSSSSLELLCRSPGNPNECYFST